MTYDHSSNRQLLLVFGFSLLENIYNYARIQVRLSQLVEGDLQAQILSALDRILTFKLRPSCVCLGKN